MSDWNQRYSHELSDRSIHLPPFPESAEDLFRHMKLHHYDEFDGVDIANYHDWADMKLSDGETIHNLHHDIHNWWEHAYHTNEYFTQQPNFIEDYHVHSGWQGTGLKYHSEKWNGSTLETLGPCHCKECNYLKNLKF